MKSIIALMLMFALTAATPAVADNTRKDLVVYRDASGELTKDSEKTAKKIEKNAETAGFALLWLTANVVFNPYADQLSPQEIAAQDQMVRDAFNEVLQPLVDQAHVWHPRAGQHIAGPGCLIRADAEGVRQLVADDRILHIFDTSWQFPE